MSESHAQSRMSTPRHQTTNLGVRSSNLFGRAINSLILIQNFCAIFWSLTIKLLGAAPGQHAVNPHSFRKTLALLGGQQCKTPEEYKAWSQNLGHEHVLTTFCSYGDVS